MSRTLVSVEQVKKALNIESFRNISKEKIMEFVSLIPNVDREIAIKIIEQYPVFAELSKSILSQLNKMCDIALEKNDESQKHVIEAYKQILDELSFQVRLDNLPKEEKTKYIEQMIEVADKMAAKDSENKAFIDKMVKYGMGVTVGVLIIGATILGVNIKGEELPKIL